MSRRTRPDVLPSLLSDADTLYRGGSCGHAFSTRSSLPTRLVPRGLTLDVRRIYDHTPEEAGRFSLTEKQADTLVLALQHGYFDVLRDT